MAKLFVQAQATSNRSEYVFVQDSASTTGGGKTGIAFNAASFSAYYVRPPVAGVGGTAVSITLATQTVSGAYSSGGWVEVDATNLPGIYRFDIPNAVFATGVDHAVVMLKGASGMAPVSLEYQIVGFDPSTAWLTSAQTAAAVWDEPYTSHTAANSMGARVLKTTVDNRPATVGTSQHIHANVHAIVDSTVAADELSGALLHNGTDYIDSNLLSGNSTRVFVGRFQMTVTGTTQGDIIEAFTTDTPAFELQLFDGDNNLVPVTGATLGLRILDVASTVVETGTPTIEYGTGGIVRWTAPGTYLSIGCPAGMYRMFVDRTVSGTTTTFGPLQIKVQVQ